MGNGSGGYQAEPGRMLDYAQTVERYASAFADAAGAGTEVTDDNQRTFTAGTNSVTLDAAFGLICQPGGLCLQQLEQQANKALNGTLQLLHTLSTNLAANAKAYQGNEGEVSKNLGAVHDRLDQQKTKVPGLTGEARRDRQGG